MKYLFLAAALMAVSALADDRTRDAQVVLKNDGFYYGAVDGKDGSETTAAIRRYQIRNGLKVTGTLDNDTLAMMGIGDATAKKGSDKPIPGLTPGKKPAEQVNPPPPGQTRPAPGNPPVEDGPQGTMPPRGKDLLRDGQGGPDPRDPRYGPQPHYPEDPQVRPGRSPAFPGDPNVVPPPRNLPNPTTDEWSTFYHGTPYATAPREVQMDVLRKAQEAMGTKRLFRGVADGYPSAATSEALFLYQEQRHLSRSGRLDLATLSDMSLLPGRSSEAPPLKPFYNPNHRRDPSVDLNGVIR